MDSHPHLSRPTLPCWNSVTPSRLPEQTRLFSIKSVNRAYKGERAPVCRQYADANTYSQREQSVLDAAPDQVIERAEHPPVHLYPGQVFEPARSWLAYR